MQCQKPGCKHQAEVKGFCKVHYRYDRMRSRETALKDVIIAIDKLAEKEPRLAHLLDDITKEAKNLYRDFKPKKATASSEIARLNAEVEELKRLVKQRNR